MADWEGMTQQRSDIEYGDNCCVGESSWNDDDDDGANNFDNEEEEEDEETILQRILLESQNSFLLEQRHLYETIVATVVMDDAKPAASRCDTIGGNVDCTTNVNDEEAKNDYYSSYSQWYDDRRYNKHDDTENSVTDTSSPNNNDDAYSTDHHHHQYQYQPQQWDIDGTVANIRDFVVDDVNDKEDDNEKEKVELEESHFCDVVDDFDDGPYDKQQQSFQHRRYCRSQYRRGMMMIEPPNDDTTIQKNIAKMPSQSSIVTNSTCAETIVTTTTRQTTATRTEDDIDGYNDQQGQEEEETGEHRPQPISNDMVIQEQMRILHAIQQQQQQQPNRTARTNPTTCAADASITESLLYHRNDQRSWNDSDTDEYRRTRQQHAINTSFDATGRETSMTITRSTPTGCRSTYDDADYRPFPYSAGGTTTTTVQRILKHHYQGENVRQEDNHDNHNEEEEESPSKVILTQCTYCTTISQVAQSRNMTTTISTTVSNRQKRLLYCTKCQQLSPIIPLSTIEVQQLLWYMNTNNNTTS